jgi:hypothetical protein
VCGVASVLLFHRAAGRVLGGVPHLLAVAIFAMSYHPIRHAADVKPYSTDLLVALALLALALEWWRDRERTHWLWLLAVSAPIAIGLSYPAAFVTGGMGVALAPSVWRTRRRAAILALGAFLGLAVATFAILFVTFIRAQAEVTLPGMSADWEGSFLPWRSPLMVPVWLVVTHAGSMLAYPCGGDRGASTLTLLAVLLGAVAFWRRRQRTVVGLCLAPLAVALVASAMRRYPYGGVTRFMLYTAPVFCLLAGAGLGSVWERIRPRLQPTLLVVVITLLAAVGTLPVAIDAAHPYRSYHAARARQFARTFWPTLEREAVPACLLWDFGVGHWNSIHLHVAVYLCNQKIYSPSRHDGIDPKLTAASSGRPLACVLVETPDVSERSIADWLERLRPSYVLRSRRSFVLEMAGPGARSRPERYSVFTLVPRTNSDPISPRLARRT